MFLDILRFVKYCIHLRYYYFTSRISTKPFTKCVWSFNWLVELDDIKIILGIVFALKKVLKALKYLGYLTCPAVPYYNNIWLNYVVFDEVLSRSTERDLLLAILKVKFSKSSCIKNISRGTCSGTVAFLKEVLFGITDRIWSTDLLPFTLGSSCTESKDVLWGRTLWKDMSKGSSWIRKISLLVKSRFKFFWWDFDSGGGTQGHIILTNLLLTLFMASRSMLQREKIKFIIPLRAQYKKF